MKVSENFVIQEFVPKAIFDTWGDRSRWFVDPRVFVVAQAMRMHFGRSMTINNWHTGGSLSNRGFRAPGSTVGGQLSQHRFGRAFDFNIPGMTAKEVYDEIRRHERKFMDLGLTTLEDVAFTPTWVHCDVRTTGLTSLLIVKP